MPKGKGTYGKKVGRPPKKKSSLLNDDREQYAEGTIEDRARQGNIGAVPYSIINPNVLLEEAGPKTDSPPSPTKKDSRSLFARFIDLFSEEQRKELLEVEMMKQEAKVADFEKRNKKRRTAVEGGDVKKQMDGLAISVAPIAVEETHTMPDGTEMPGATHEEYEEQTMLPDEEMEEDYVDYVMEETLSNEDRNYLISALEKDDRLSEIFDQVVESATEFSGSGPIEGPGSEMSDSIPARLSDGEFVFTAKAADEIGEDNLMSMMKEAEANADKRQPVANGGYINVDRDDDTQIPIQTTESAKAQSKVQPVYRRKTVEQLEEEMLKSNPRRRYAVISG